MEKAIWKHKIFGIPYFALRFADGGSGEGAAAGGTEAAGIGAAGAEGGTGNASGGTGEETGTGTGGEEEKQFSQTDLDAAIEKRLARERKKWERESKQQTTKQPPAAEEGTKQEKDDGAEKLSKANAHLVKSEAKAAAIAVGVKPEKVPYVVKLADLDGIDVDEDDGPDTEAIKKAIDKVLKDMPELKAAQETGKGAGFQIGADGTGKPATARPAQSVQNPQATKRWNRFR